MSKVSSSASRPKNGIEELNPELDQICKLITDLSDRFGDKYQFYLAIGWLGSDGQRNNLSLDKVLFDRKKFFTLLSIICDENIEGDKIN